MTQFSSRAQDIIRNVLQNKIFRHIQLNETYLSHNFVTASTALLKENCLFLCECHRILDLKYEIDYGLND